MPIAENALYAQLASTDSSGRVLELQQSSWKSYKVPTCKRRYHQEKENTTLHELNKTLSLLIYFFQDQ